MCAIIWRISPYTSSYTNAAGEQVEDQLQIALTIVDPTNGYVVAMIGGAGERWWTAAGTGL